MADNENSECCSYHILIDGSRGCGKTSLINRFATDKFEHEKKQTKRYEMNKVTVQVGSRQVETAIWDMGKEKVASSSEDHKLASSLLFRKPVKAISGVMVAYDVNNRRSYVEAKQKIRQLQQIKWEPPVLLLVGNKIDRNEREVPEDEAQHFAKSKLIEFIETSALSGYHVKDAFQRIITDIINMKKFTQMLQKAKSELKDYNLV